jgi:hypothetical protein
MNADKKGGFGPPSRCYFLQHGQWQSALQVVPQQPVAAAVDTAPPTSSAINRPRLIKMLFIAFLLF